MLVFGGVVLEFSKIFQEISFQFDGGRWVGFEKHGERARSGRKRSDQALYEFLGCSAVTCFLAGLTVGFQDIFPGGKWCSIKAAFRFFFVKLGIDPRVKN